MKITELGIILLLIVSITGCSGKDAGTDAKIGQPNALDAKRVLENNWAYIKWIKFDKTSIEEKDVAGAPVYVMKFKAEGICLKTGQGCQSEGDKVAWKNGVVGFERTPTGWQAGLPRGDISKI